MAHVEIYMATERYSRGNIAEAARHCVECSGKVSESGKISCCHLPSEVRFLRLECKASFRPNMLLIFYFVPPLEPAVPSEELIADGENSATGSHNWILPNAGFDGLWEGLFLADNLKNDLLRYASVCLEFGQKRVNPNIILCNRLIFLHGPPGTGKTTICKALAQKLSIRFIESYPTAQLVEINCHSLLSKWFSESGKLVTKLFESIRSYASAPNALVIVLIDEVESLTFARQSAANGNEPSDAIRVVNAVLTQLDSLRFFPNVITLATSNLSAAIDPAFKDRADFVQYIGLPTKSEISSIFMSCCEELENVGMFPHVSLTLPLTERDKIIESMVGLSGRAIRKLPMLALAQTEETDVSAFKFLFNYLPIAVQKMKSGIDTST